MYRYCAYFLSEIKISHTKLYIGHLIVWSLFSFSHHKVPNVFLLITFDPRSGSMESVDQLLNLRIDIETEIYLQAKTVNEQLLEKVRRSLQIFSSLLRRIF
jgi:hypothetical protein